MLLLVCVALFLIPGCHKTPKIQPSVKNVTIEVWAPKAKVFEAASFILIKRGFIINVANDNLGLLTTEFRSVDQGLQERIFINAMFGTSKPEVQFSTSIIEKEGVSTLTIVAKGRTFHKKRGYYDYIFGDDFMNGVRRIGEEIKFEAEGK
jgi:hypothetical protein